MSKEVKEAEVRLHTSFGEVEAEDYELQTCEFIMESEGTNNKLYNKNEIEFDPESEWGFIKYVSIGQHKTQLEWGTYADSKTQIIFREEDLFIEIE